MQLHLSVLHNKIEILIGNNRILKEIYLLTLLAFYYILLLSFLPVSVVLSVASTFLHSILPHWSLCEKKKPVSLNDAIKVSLIPKGELSWWLLCLLSCLWVCHGSGAWRLWQWIWANLDVHSLGLIVRLHRKNHTRAKNNKKKGKLRVRQSRKKKTVAPLSWTLERRYFV